MQPAVEQVASQVEPAAKDITQGVIRPAGQKLSDNAVPVTEEIARGRIEPAVKQVHQILCPIALHYESYQTLRCGTGPRNQYFGVTMPSFSKGLDKWQTADTPFLPAFLPLDLVFAGRLSLLNDNGKNPGLSKEPSHDKKTLQEIRPLVGTNRCHRQGFIKGDCVYLQAHADQRCLP